MSGMVTGTSSVSKEHTLNSIIGKGQIWLFEDKKLCFPDLKGDFQMVAGSEIDEIQLLTFNYHHLLLFMPPHSC